MGCGTSADKSSDFSPIDFLFKLGADDNEERSPDESLPIKGYIQLTKCEPTGVGSHEILSLDKETSTSYNNIQLPAFHTVSSTKPIHVKQLNSEKLGKFFDEAVDYLVTPLDSIDLYSTVGIMTE